MSPMDKNFYKQAFDKAIEELTETMSQREKLDNEREQVDRRIVKIRSGLDGLATLCGKTPESLREEYPQLFPNEIAPDVGLTDAVREVLKSTRYFSSPVLVRDKLKEIGYDLSKYTNELANIHTVLKRLVENDEATITTREGKTLYKFKRLRPKPIVPKS